MQASLAIEIRQKALKSGADLIGFAPIHRFERYAPEYRPTYTFQSGKTVIVLAINMIDPLLDIWIHAPPTTGTGRSELGRAFEDEILRGICYRIALFLEQKGFKSKVLPYQPDLPSGPSGAIYLKDAGVLAGLGVIGKNNLLITPQFGPRIRLRALVTEAELPPNRIITENPWCEDCERCIIACPVKALDNGQYDSEKCLTSPLHRRKLSPNTELWCTRCSCVCPVGIRVPCDDTVLIQPQ